MPKIPRTPPRLRQLGLPLLQMALTFLLTSSQLARLHAPFALALVALSGPCLGGLLSLLGAAGGAFLFFDFQPGLRFLASAILIYSANTAFYDTAIYRRPAFPPAIAALATALVQSIYLLDRPMANALIFLFSLALQCAAYLMLRPLISSLQQTSGQPEALLALLGCLAISLVGVESSAGFSLGRALMATVLLAAIAPCSAAQGALMGLVAGLTLDLQSPLPQPFFAVAVSGSCALSALLSRYRLSAGAAYCLTAAAAVLLFGADSSLVLIWESLFGTAIYFLLPRRLTLQPAANHEAVPLPPSPLQNQLEQSAAAFRELYDSFFRGTNPTPPENPSVLFDRTAEQVCRHCVLCSNCWQQNYNTTYNAFNDACGPLLRRGQAQAQDFPLYFTSRCVHLQEFLATLNTELRTFLLRRQYHQRLLEARRQAQEQYAQLGELLSGTAAVEAMASPPLGYRIGTALRPRQGCHVCGDQLDVFEAGSTLELLLSDGMGSGEGAHREAAMTVRLLRQFLQAGIDPVPALKTLNSALMLRGEDGGGFTTIDLLALQRSSGSATLYKYGAAPSYLKRGGAVTRFTAATLPAGLQSGRQEPEFSRFALPGGSFFVMVSDGIADEHSDEWLQNLLAGWDGKDAQALTALIMAESRSRKGESDDCAVLAVYLATPDEGQKTGI